MGGDRAHYRPTKASVTQQIRSFLAIFKASLRYVEQEKRFGGEKISRTNGLAIQHDQGLLLKKRNLVDGSRIFLFPAGRQS